MKNRVLFLVPLAVLALCNQSRAASAPDPGDYVPAPAGATVTALYAQHQKADRVYENGRRALGDLGLRLDIGVLRVMHYFELGGKPADIELVLPFGRQRVGGDDTRLSGVGNVILGTTYWTKSDEASQTHLGWAGYLSLPSGAHRKASSPARTATRSTSSSATSRRWRPGCRWTCWVRPSSIPATTPRASSASPWCAPSRT